MIFSFLILSGCEELPFTDEDIQGIVPESEINKEETEEETNNFQGENETPLSKNQRETLINIEEREIIDAVEFENSKTTITEDIAGGLSEGIKVSITDSSLGDDERVIDTDLTGTKESGRN